MGAEPPKATRVRPASPLPHSTACVRAALDMFSSTISLIPSAPSVSSSPSFAPGSLRMAAAARSRSRGIAPPAKKAGSMRPSTTSASVTVGRGPARQYAAGPGSTRRWPPHLVTVEVVPRPQWTAPAPISTISITGMRTGRPLPLLNR